MPDLSDNCTNTNSMTGADSDLILRDDDIQRNGSIFPYFFTYWRYRVTQMTTIVNELVDVREMIITSMGGRQLLILLLFLFDVYQYK